MHRFAATCLITVIWIIVGYSLAFTEGTSFVGGLSKLFLAGLSVGAVNGSIPDSAFMTFQMTFATIAAVLISGAIAERIKFSALLLFLGSWFILVYSPICYWVWGGGFLGDAGVLDFAGGTVVHINSGIAALVAAIVLGKRVGYGRENLAPHNVVLTVVGASFLWVGWFGFNGGSAVAANGAAGMAVAVTQIATAAAALAWMLAAMDDASEAQRAGYCLRRHCGPRRDYTGFRFCRSRWCACHRPHRWRDLFLGRRVAQA